MAKSLSEQKKFLGSSTFLLITFSNVYCKLNIKKANAILADEGFACRNFSNIEENKCKTGILSWFLTKNFK